jgi:hypothetical protein
MEIHAKRFGRFLLQLMQRFNKFDVLDHQVQLVRMGHKHGIQYNRTENK